MNRNNPLVSVYQNGFSEELSAGPEQTLEKIEIYNEMGWHENVKEEARQFLSETGIDVSELEKRAHIDIQADLSEPPVTTEASLTKEFHSEYGDVSELADFDIQRELEIMDVYDDMGWNAALRGKAEDFKDKTGVDVSRFAKQAGVNL